MMFVLCITAIFFFLKSLTASSRQVLCRVSCSISSTKSYTISQENSIYLCYIKEQVRILFELFTLHPKFRKSRIYLTLSPLPPFGIIQ